MRIFYGANVPFVRCIDIVHLALKSATRGSNEMLRDTCPEHRVSEHFSQVATARTRPPAARSPRDALGRSSSSLATAVPKMLRLVLRTRKRYVYPTA